MQDSSGDPFQDLDLRAQLAAYLTAHSGRSQQEAAREMGISQSQVSRLLKHAEKAGWLKRALEFDGRDISKDNLDLIARADLPKRLLHLVQAFSLKFQTIQPQIWRYPNGAGQSSNSNAVHTSGPEFNRAAARRLAELFRSANYVGVTWGGTIKGVIESLPERPLGLREDKKIQVVPVCPELITSTNFPYSSSHLANRLNELVRNDYQTSLSLAGIAAYIPLFLSAEEESGIRKFLNHSINYRKIFGADDNESPLIDKIDCVLTSIGRLKKPLGNNVQELTVAAEPLTEQKILDLIVSDFGGLLLPERDLDDSNRALVDALNKRWMGIKEEHFKRIARKASKKDDGVGNVVIAVGAEKAPVLLEAIRRGLVNHVITDDNLVCRLQDLLEVEDRM